MEKLSAVAAAQSSGSTTALQHGTRPSREETMQLQNLLRQMQAAFPHQETAPETAKIWRLAVEDLVAEFSLLQVEAALRTFLTHQKFFPHPSEIREELEAMKTKQLAAERAKLPKVGCDACDGSGLVFGIRSGERCARACACLLAYRRAKAGVQPAPAAHDGKRKAAGE